MLFSAAVSASDFKLEGTTYTSGCVRQNLHTHPHSSIHAFTFFSGKLISKHFYFRDLHCKDSLNDDDEWTYFYSLGDKNIDVMSPHTTEHFLAYAFRSQLHFEDEDHPITYEAILPVEFSDGAGIIFTGPQNGEDCGETVEKPCRFLQGPVYYKKNGPL